MENPFNYYQLDRGNFKGLVLNCNIKLPLGLLMAETSKDIHIVFQVLNFLCGFVSEPYNLSSDEKMLLIILARHKGVKGIYPSLTTLSKELQRNRRNILRSMKKLEDKKLIIIEKSTGRSNHYQLALTSGVDATGGVHATSGVDATPPVTNMVKTSGVDATLSIKSINTDKIIERARKKLAPISPDFLPNQKTKAFISDLAIRDECILEIAEAFIDYFLDSGEARKDWDFECRKWFKREVEMRGNEIRIIEKVCISVEPKEKERAMEEKDRLAAKEALANIMGKLNGKGGHHGLLRNGRELSEDN